MSQLVLTPEANAEVHRNMKLGGGLIVGPILLLVVLLITLINPPGSTEGFRIASVLLIALFLPILAMIGTWLVLAYPMGCWPGLLRAQKLTAFYGISSDEVSNSGMRRWMKRRAFYMAHAKGLAVSFAFVTPWFLTSWAIKGRFPEGVFFPSLIFMQFSGGLASKAWVVRQLVAEKGEEVAATGEVSQRA